MVLSVELRKCGVLEAAGEVGRVPIIPAFENPGQLSPEPMRLHVIAGMQASPPGPSGKWVPDVAERGQRTCPRENSIGGWWA